MFSQRVLTIGLVIVVSGFLLVSCQSLPAQEKITEVQTEPFQKDAGADKTPPQCQTAKDCSDCAETCENNRCVLLSCTQDQDCRCGYVCLSGGCFAPDLEVRPDR